MSNYIMSGSILHGFKRRICNPRRAQIRHFLIVPDTEFLSLAHATGGPPQEESSIKENAHCAAANLPLKADGVQHNPRNAKGIAPDGPDHRLGACSALSPLRRRRIRPERTAKINYAAERWVSVVVRHAVIPCVALADPNGISGVAESRTCCRAA